MHDRQHGERLQFGPFELDVRERELRRSGERVRLQGKPFELLVALLARPGELVTREELRRRLWTDDTFVGFDENLNAAVRKTREALGDSATIPLYIETVPRYGYRFIARLQQTDIDIGPPTPPLSPASPLADSRQSSKRQLWYAVAVAVIVAAVATAWWVRSGDSAARPDVVRLQIRPPDDTFYPAGAPRVAVSPDGRQVAFVAVAGPLGRSVWVQSLDAAVPSRLAGSEYAWDPFWSPDGSEIAFMANGKLHRVSVTGRTAITLGEADGSAGTWSRESGILVPRRAANGIVRISPGDGAWEQATAVDRTRGETHHVWPQFLPDGRSFIYLSVCDRPENSGIYLARLGEAGRTRLLDTQYKAAYAAPGFLLFIRNGSLLAQRVDLAAGRLHGEVHEIASNVPVLPVNGAAGFSLSPTGVLVHAQPYRPPQRQLVWLNRMGQHLKQVGGPNAVTSFALSPDDRTAIIEGPGPQNLSQDLWSLDLQSGVRALVTENGGNDESPVWGPGPGRFTYARHRAIHQVSDLYTAGAPTADEHRPILVNGVSNHPSDWSADGRYLLFEVEDRGGKRDLWLTASDGRAPSPWLATAFDERRARFSPDGRAVAYESDHSGRTEVYVRGFEPPHTTWQLSTSGGSQPEWHRDGAELFFLSADFRLMSVRLQPGSSLQAEPARPLFEIRRLAAAPKTSTPYAVSADGQRFLVALVTDEGGDSPIQVILNWPSLLVPERTHTSRRP